MDPCVKCGTPREQGKKCKPCSAAYMREWYAKNKVRIRDHRTEVARQWIANNLDRHREYQRVYQANVRAEYTPEKLEATRAYARDRAAQKWADKPEEMRAYSRAQYYRHNISRRQRQRPAQDGGTITESEWIAILERQNQQCAMCRRDDVPLTIDHIIPVSRGGSGWAHNVQALCRPCNSRKHNKLPGEY